MYITLPKYDVMERNLKDRDVEAAHAQVAYLYAEKHMSYQEIADITGYVVSTVKVYVSKYLGEERRFDEFFNPAAAPRVIIQPTELGFFKDAYNHHEAPEECGLYLIGSTYFDPITHAEYYWIKVGMSLCLTKRLQSYATENPMYWLADTLTVGDDVVRPMERDCHVMLSDVAIARAKDTKEWFMVDRETYFEICSKGFNYFFD